MTETSPFPETTLPISVAATADGAGELVARRILQRLAARDGDDFYLACPAGRTPSTTYAALGRLAGEQSVDLSPVVIVMVDEYVVDGPDGVARCDPGAHFSCRRYVEDHLLPLVNAGLPVAMQIRRDRVRCPDPVDPATFDDELDARGGIDLFLLASGASDGHVAFNPPGTPIDAPTRVVTLAESTRRDNLSTFPGFRDLSDVPALGVTVGLRAILRSREVVLTLLGGGKAGAFERVLSAGAFDPRWPATVIHRCTQPWVVVDQAAAGPLRAESG